MASLLDTVGGYVQQIGLPGAEANGKTDAPKSTFINVGTTNGLDSAGMVDFGVVVAKYPGADNNAGLLQTGYLRPVGISSRRIKRGADPSTKLVGYKTNDEFAVYETGDVVCMAAENVNENDQVIALVTPYSPSTGISTNVGGDSAGTASGSRIAVPGHVWKTTTSQGQLGVVAVYRRDIAPYIS
jgi:hypothetical protein